MADLNQNSLLPVYLKGEPSGYVPFDLTKVTGGIYAHVQVLGVAGGPLADPVASQPSPTTSTGVTLPPHTSTFQIDTGSWATVMPSSLISDTFDPTTYPPGSVTYTSDNGYHAGNWVPLVLAFPDARLPDGTVPTTTVTALVVDKSSGTHMMGVGFDVLRSLEVYHGTGKPQVEGHTLTAADNALLNLVAMTDGDMAHSYAITAQGIVLGARPDAAEGWVTHQLQPEDVVAPNGLKSWALAQVMSTLDGVPRGSFETLFDIGLNKMFYEFPGGSAVKRGDHTITISLADSQGGGISYSFDTDGHSSQEPTSVTVETPQHGGSFINTGVNVLRGFDYLFDAEAGTVSLRPNTSGQDTVIKVTAPLDAATFGTLTAGPDADGAVAADGLVHGAVRANLPFVDFVDAAIEVHFADGELGLGSASDAAYVTRLYDGLFGREAEMTGLWFWNDGLGGGMSRTDVATGFLSSDEGIALFGGLSDSAFVSTLYKGLLDRVGAAAENGFWTELLSTGVGRAAVLEGIADSAEARSISANETAQIWVADPVAWQVGTAYGTALGRLPDAEGLKFWMKAWEAGLSDAEFDAAIVASSEFQALHRGQSQDALASSFYKNGLGRAPSASELAAVTDYSPEQLLAMVTHSAEAARYFNDIL